MVTVPIIGMISPPNFPPEQVQATARRAEQAGVAELWVWEDCFKQTGIASMTAALAATERLRVGVGIMPMPLRNVALSAMEVATIERMFPGRARFGFGHGVLSWMGQAGCRVASPLTLMREYIPALRSLLAGEQVTAGGRYVRLDQVQLDWPPLNQVPVLAAAEGSKTIELTGEVADGTIFTSGFTPDMVRTAAERIRRARQAAARPGHHELVVFVPAQDDRAATGTRVREYADAGATTVLLQPPAGETDLMAFAGTVGALSR